MRIEGPHIEWVITKNVQFVAIEKINVILFEFILYSLVIWIDGLKSKAQVFKA